MAHFPWDLGKLVASGLHLADLSPQSFGAIAIASSPPGRKQVGSLRGPTNAQASGPGWGAVFSTYRCAGPFLMAYSAAETTALVTVATECWGGKPCRCPY